MLRFLGNIIWILLGGIWLSLEWFLAGLLLCITVIGIPAGKQCFKLARFSLLPFGREIEDRGGAVSLILNIIWIVVCGWEIALTAITSGLAMLVTIVGIPFAWQSFKLARLALFPFGAQIVESGAAERQRTNL